MENVPCEDKMSSSPAATELYNGNTAKSEVSSVSSTPLHNGDHSSLEHEDTPTPSSEDVNEEENISDSLEPSLSEEKIQIKKACLKDAEDPRDAEDVSRSSSSEDSEELEDDSVPTVGQEIGPLGVPLDTKYKYVDSLLPVIMRKRDFVTTLRTSNKLNKLMKFAPGEAWTKHSSILRYRDDLLNRDRVYPDLEYTRATQNCVQCMYRLEEFQNLDGSTVGSQYICSNLTEAQYMLNEKLNALFKEKRYAFHFIENAFADRLEATSCDSKDLNTCNMEIKKIEDIRSSLRGVISVLEDHYDSKQLDQYWMSFFTDAQAHNRSFSSDAQVANRILEMQTENKARVSDKKVRKSKTAEVDRQNLDLRDMDMRAMLQEAGDSEVVEEDSEVVEEDSEVVEDDSEVVEDDSEVVEDDSEVVEEDSEVVEEDSEVVEDDSEVVEDDSEVVEEDSEVVEDDTEVDESYSEAVEGDKKADDDASIVVKGASIMNGFPESLDESSENQENGDIKPRQVLPKSNIDECGKESSENVPCSSGANVPRRGDLTDNKENVPPLATSGSKVVTDRRSLGSLTTNKDSVLPKVETPKVTKAALKQGNTGPPTTVKSATKKQKTPIPSVRDTKTSRTRASKLELSQSGGTASGTKKDLKNARMWK